MIPTLEHFGVGSIPWSALARGLLTRPWKAGSEREKNDPWAVLYSGLGDSSAKIVGTVEKIAQARGVSMAQVGLAWVLSKDAVSAPIFGATKLQNLYDIQGKHMGLATMRICLFVRQALSS
jgi:aryl-alcohol dehydrogenase-like predicted oxidoreductase